MGEVVGGGWDGVAEGVTEAVVVLVTVGGIVDSVVVVFNGQVRLLSSFSLQRA